MGRVHEPGAFLIQTLEAEKAGSMGLEGAFERHGPGGERG